MDADARKVGTRVGDVPVLGTDEVLRAYDPGEVILVNALGSSGSTRRRREAYERAKALGYSFLTVVHPTAAVSSSAVIGEGAQLLAGSVIGAEVRIGADAILNSCASVDHECSIGAHAHLAPGTTLSGRVCVGVGTHIGTGASVIQNIRIGKSAVIGAGAAVVRDVPDGALVCGVPARAVRAMG